MGIRGYASSCPRCKQARISCMAYKNGNCLILTDTEFGKKPCPFYKEKPQKERKEDD